MINTTQQAIEQCRDNNLTFYNLALAFCIAFVQQAKNTFTVDDLKSECTKIIEPPRESRAWGCVMRKLKSDGHIFPLHKEVKSKDPICHERPKAVYVSRAYREERRKRTYSAGTTLNLFA